MNREEGKNTLKSPKGRGGKSTFSLIFKVRYSSVLNLSTLIQPSLFSSSSPDE